MFLIISISAVSAAGYCIYEVKKAVAYVTEPDLSPLAELISKKIIVLTAEQKESLRKYFNQSFLGEQYPNGGESIKNNYQKYKGLTERRLQTHLDEFSSWLEAERRKKAGQSIRKMLEGNQ